MMGLLGFLYLAVGYYLFWKVLKKTEPGIPCAWAVPLLALVFGPPIFAFAIGRIIVNPKYRPIQATFIEIELSGEPGQRPYRTIWSSLADEGEIIA